MESEEGGIHSFHLNVAFQPGNKGHSGSLSAAIFSTTVSLTEAGLTRSWRAGQLAWQ